ncbi:MAG: peptidase M4 [Methanosarcinales archaeon]|nr:peptidase M4 [Methanosarcinales archaeon]
MLSYPEGREPISDRQAWERAGTCASSFGPRARVHSLMKFSSSYYARIVDGQTGENLAELMVDRYSGAVYPEPGPCFARAASSRETAGEGDVQPYDQEGARSRADSFLAGYCPGSRALDGEDYPGYYSFYFGRQDTEGILSVNSSDGRVWVHSWHGIFLEEVLDGREKEGSPK